jgi:hypothetical protein
LGTGDDDCCSFAGPGDEFGKSDPQGYLRMGTILHEWPKEPQLILPFQRRSAAEHLSRREWVSCQHVAISLDSFSGL